MCLVLNALFLATQQAHEQTCQELRQGHAEEVIRRLQEVAQQTEATHASEINKVKTLHDSQLAEVTCPRNPFSQFTFILSVNLSIYHSTYHSIFTLKHYQHLLSTPIRQLQATTVS